MFAAGSIKFDIGAFAANNGSEISLEGYRYYCHLGTTNEIFPWRDIRQKSEEKQTSGTLHCIPNATFT